MPQRASLHGLSHNLSHGLTANAAQQVANPSSDPIGEFGAAQRASNKVLVRFYVYPHQVSEQERLDFACLLAEKAQAAGKRVAILCADVQQAALLDERLWAFKPQSFLTHCHSDEDIKDRAAVVLSVAPQRLVTAEVAINLSVEHHIDMPKASERVFEIVNQIPAVLTATRARYQRYKQIGFTPQTYTI